MTNETGLATAVCAVVFLVSDVVAIAASGVIIATCMALLWPSPLSPELGATPPAWRVMIAIFWVAILYLGAKGRYSRRIPFWIETGTVAIACLYAGAAAVVLGFLNDNAAISIMGLAAVPLFGILATVGNSLAKLLVSRASLWTFPVVIVGQGQAAEGARAALESDRSLGYRCVAQVDPVAVVGTGELTSLRSVLRRSKARGLLIALDSDDDNQKWLVSRALRERIPFQMAQLPNTLLPACGWEPLHLFGHGTTIVSFGNPQSIPMTRFAKTAIDIFVAVLLLVASAPLFIILSILSRLDGGPAFFAHRRIGAGGRPFPCLKFRTMVVDSEPVLAAYLANNPVAASEWEETHKLKNDPRVTRVGRFMRKTSLDELPQLFNVLRLEMSLVGPRPIVESEVAYYGEDISHYYAARPGLTGMWQVSGRSDTSYARRVELDVWYVKNWTIWNDIVLILKTIPAVVGGQGAR